MMTTNYEETNYDIALLVPGRLMSWRMKVRREWQNIVWPRGRGVCKHDESSGHVVCRRNCILVNMAAAAGARL